MSDREQELAERHARLRVRCAFERRAISHETQKILLRFGTVDRLAVMARKTLLQPRMILAGVVALLAFGRGRSLHLLGRLLFLASTARRLWRVAKLL